MMKIYPSIHPIDLGSSCSYICFGRNAVVEPILFWPMAPRRVGDDGLMFLSDGVEVGGEMMKNHTSIHVLTPVML